MRRRATSRELHHGITVHLWNSLIQTLKTSHMSVFNKQSIYVKLETDITWIWGYILFWDQCRGSSRFAFAVLLCLPKYFKQWINISKLVNYISVIYCPHMKTWDYFVCQIYFYIKRNVIELLQKRGSESPRPHAEHIIWWLAVETKYLLQHANFFEDSRRTNWLFLKVSEDIFATLKLGLS